MTSTTRRSLPWRFAVPVAIAAAAAGAVTLGPAAFADDTDPDLPDLTAEQLVARIAQSDTTAMSGTVRVDTDLGLPALPGGSAAGPQALVSGTHRLRVAVDGVDRQRVGIMSDLAEYDIVHNGRDVWTYDSRAHAVTHTTVEATASDDASFVPTTPRDAARRLLDLVGPTTDVRVAGTTSVAGHDAYELRFAPKASGSLIAHATVSVDAETGVPLRVTVDTVAGGDPAVDIGFENVSYTRPDASTFAFEPPAGATVKELPLDAAGDPARARLAPPSTHGGGTDPNPPALLGDGWATVVELPSGGKDKDLTGLLGKIGRPVDGGTLVSTRLLNVLTTDSGRTLVGAVDAETLARAAAAPPESVAGR